MKKKKILIMGLPGSGKTTLASKIVPLLKAKWLNNNEVRKDANDWDFTESGRIRQAKRMADFAEKYKQDNQHVVADFICPIPEARKLFNADYIIWMNTISKGRFEDTNKIFEAPENHEVDYTVNYKNADFYKYIIVDKIEEYKWDNKKPTAQMLGRWQPWHKGHQKLFEEVIKKIGQVNIMVRDVKGVGDNPFNFKTVKKNISESLKEFENRIKITLVPNITNIFYGRGVGYKIEEIVLDKDTQKISATEIRKKMRKSKKL